MTPQHAKMLLSALRENVEKYERNFGEIKVFAGPVSPNAPFGFQPPGA